jgi:hypothetical protein
MATDEFPGQKTGSDDASTDDLPQHWDRGSDDSEAVLIHSNGAKLIIRRTSPPKMPDPTTPPVNQSKHYALEFQPPGREGLVPVVETGSLPGQINEAERFANMAPHGRPDVELFASWVSEEQL